MIIKKSGFYWKMVWLLNLRCSNSVLFMSDSLKKILIRGDSNESQNGQRNMW